MSRPPLPPFTIESAAQKARMAEDAWNTRDPSRVALAYTMDSVWRNRSEFFQGRRRRGSLKALDPKRPIREADSCTAANSSLFDHLVGELLELIGHVKT